MLHELPLDGRTLHGHFSRDLKPVLAIDPGDSVRFAVPNAGWYLESGDQLASRNPAVDDGHALAGPIEVRGARAGQTLVVRIDEVRAGSWGVTFAGRSYELRWELDGDVGRAGGHTVPLAPFLGVLGMPPLEPGVYSTGPPRRSAGTSTARSSSRARPSTSRSRSTGRCSRPETGTPRRATARSRARRSNARPRRG